MDINIQKNSNGLSIFAGNNSLMTNSVGNQKMFGKNENGNSIYAGNLGLTTDKIEQTRKQAQKKAMKVLTDELSNEKKIDDMVEEQKQKVAELKEEMLGNAETLKDVREAKERYMAEYGLDKEGAKPTQEQMLELIEFNKAESELTRNNILAKEEAKARNMAVEDIMVERLKSHGMVDAQKEAEDIMGSASEEIIGMLTDEAKNHVDETLEEQKEKAEEIKEKKEEQEEKLQEKRETPQQQAVSNTAKTMGELQDINQECEMLQKELKVMVNTNQILEEDLKGLLLDQAF